MEELPFQNHSSMLIVLLRGKSSAKVTKSELWNIGKKLVGQMIEVLHYFRPPAEFTSGERHPKLRMRMWYGHPYHDILPDPSLLCKVALLTTTT
ncbi:hypothetical protein AVEN_180504-1 [Araneus ventricosus]|uniref:Uncharacterized protein n=1 Tax=Araneus ventricosus TaxID=182803 RepID=A0A4Y2SVF7_ARAVE|nr:hypothetical protein AVEN_180504-1 [Araneus ventricosus]